MLITCSKCKKEKSPEEFYKSQKKSKQCIECRRQYARTQYIEKTRYYKNKAKRRNQTQSEILKEALANFKSRPCQDCGQEYPHYVIDLDHRDPESKYRINQRPIQPSVRLKVSLSTFIDECNKCDVVCSNCHRIRTHAPKEI